MEKRLYVVGIGPGAREQMTIRADQVLKTCEVIAGYPVYTDLIREYYPEAEYRTTPMRQEKERCRLALEAAAGGKKTALVCSGDSGVYGMAGLALQMSASYPEVMIEMIPGVTAALSGGALLGAPLGHDFAVISLSDLLTPWERIEKRLRAAAEGDFIICLYNPASKKRKDYLERACRILLEQKDKETVCGMVRNIGRVGERVELYSLEDLSRMPADMFTTVFIGNTSTIQACGRMITPRGYKDVRTDE